MRRLNDISTWNWNDPAVVENFFTAGVMDQQAILEVVNNDNHENFIRIINQIFQSAYIQQSDISLAPRFRLFVDHVSSLINEEESARIFGDFIRHSYDLRTPEPREVDEFIDRNLYPIIGEDRFSAALIYFRSQDGTYAERTITAIGNDNIEAVISNGMRTALLSTSTQDTALQQRIQIVTVLAHLYDQEKLRGDFLCQLLGETTQKDPNNHLAVHTFQTIARNSDALQTIAPYVRSLPQIRQTAILNLARQELGNEQYAEFLEISNRAPKGICARVTQAVEDCLKSCASRLMRTNSQHQHND